MGFKFRKSVKIAPGVKLNLNKKSVGVTFGGKGAHYTVNSSGKKTTSMGVPGTGLYYSNTSNGTSSSDDKKHDMKGGNTQMKSENKKAFYESTWFIILSLLLFAPLGVYLMYKFAPWSKKSKHIATAVFGIWFLVACVGAFSPSPADETNTPAPVSYESTTAEIYASIAKDSTDKETSSEKSTEKATSKPTEKTTNKPTENSVEKQTQKTPAKDITYVLNIKTKKYHRPSCSDVKNIKPENYQESASVPNGYTPCGHCKPN